VTCGGDGNVYVALMAGNEAAFLQAVEKIEQSRELSDALRKVPFDAVNLAPLAGEAFCFITGADLLVDDLIQRDPEVCESHKAPLAQKRKQDPWTQAYEDGTQSHQADLILRLSHIGVI
jgi:hypothetical protein